MDYKQIKISDNLVLNYVNVSKFKTVEIAIYLKGEVNESEVSSLRLLSFLLGDSSKKYPSNQELSAYKEYLYNLGLFSSLTHFGGASYFGMQANFISPRYLGKDNDLLDKVFALIAELLYSPKLDGNKFDEELFNRIKNNTILRYKSFFDEKESYSAMKLDGFINGEHPYKISAQGSLEGLNKCSAESVYKQYLKLLNRPIEIYAVGELDETQLIKTIKKYLKPGNDKECNNYSVALPKNNQEEHIENTKFLQSELKVVLIGPEIKTLKELVTQNLFNGIYGSGASSKLFRIVREKYNYCYTINSMYRALSNSYVISAGIDDKNYKHSVELISLLLKEMQDGNFSDADMELVKKTNKMSQKAVLDNARGIINRIFNEKLDGISYSNKEYDLAMDKLTKQDIIDYARKIELSYSYYLKQGGEQ